MSAGRKWALLAADIVAYEVAHRSDGELLSEFCDRWMERQPILARTFIIALGSVLTAHLANLLDPRFDPIGGVFWRRIFGFPPGARNNT